METHHLAGLPAGRLEEVRGLHGHAQRGDQRDDDEHLAHPHIATAMSVEDEQHHQRRQDRPDHHPGRQYDGIGGVGLEMRSRSTSSCAVSFHPVRTTAPAGWDSAGWRIAAAARSTGGPARCRVGCAGVWVAPCCGAGSCPHRQGCSGTPAWCGRRRSCHRGTPVARRGDDAGPRSSPRWLCSMARRTGAVESPSWRNWEYSCTRARASVSSSRWTADPRDVVVGVVTVADVGAEG